MYKIEEYLKLNLIPLDLTKEERKEYGKWFMENKHLRIDMIIALIKSTKGFENWPADFSPESLKKLCLWYQNAIEFRTLTEYEMKVQMESLPKNMTIEPTLTILTDKSYSIVCDVGIYFGEVFVTNWSQTYWIQCFTKLKRYMYEGQMVVRGSNSKMELNPLAIMRIVALKIEKGDIDKDHLFNLYNIWLDNLDVSVKKIIV